MNDQILPPATTLDTFNEREQQLLMAISCLVQQAGGYALLLPKTMEDLSKNRRMLKQMVLPDGSMELTIIDGEEAH